MRKTLLSTLIASLFAAAPALAQSDTDPMRVQGTATVEGFYNNEKATDNAKLNEYQDLGNGALSNVGMQGRNSTTWFQGYGENFGRSDQFMFIRGGMYGVFKAGAYLNDIPHTFSSNAFSPFAGIGSNTLTARFPLAALPDPQPPNTWSQFTLGYDRRDAGGYAEWQKNSPWYFRVDGNQVTFNGTKPGSGSNGTSPGNGYTDLAIPTNFQTSNWGVEGGYQSNTATLSLRWDYSKFDNGSNTLQWTNPFFTTTGAATSPSANLLDTTYLPPDNTFNKFTVSGNYRDLPWRSVVSARYTWAKTTSDVPLATSALTAGTGIPAGYYPTLPDIGTFNGENINQSFQLAWTAHPVSSVESKVYYYWTKLQNNSTVVEYGSAPTQPLTSGLGCGNFTPDSGPTAGIPTQIVGNCDTELFDYTKNNVGIDIWWKFAPGNRLGGGWDYNDLDQTRIDYDHSHWNKLWAEYKNTMVDTLLAKVKYWYLKRDSTLNFTTDVPGGANNPNYMSAYTSAFDLQSSTTNAVKLSLDWNPLMNVGVSFEGNWSKTDFDDVTFGRTSQDKQGYFLSGYWNASETLRLSAFGDWEDFKYPSNHRYIGTVAGGPNPPSGWCTAANPLCYSPFVPPYQQSPGSGTASYNWNSQTKDTTWMIGIGADWQAMEALKLGASYLYVSNEGNATFGYQNGVVLNNPPVLPIDNFDDAKQQYFNLKATWNYNRNWSIVGGYSYMKYSHDDIATSGYQYVLPIVTNNGKAIVPTPATNTSLSYLNGYDAFTDGHANIFWLGVTYKFDAPPLPAAR